MSTLLKIIKIIIYLLVFLVLLIGFLPSIFSTNWGKNYLIERINRSIPGRIEIDAMDLSWWNGQKIRNFSLIDTDGKKVLDGEEFVTQTSLWEILNRNNLLNSSRLVQLNAIIEADDQGITGIERALGYSFTTPEKFSHTSRIILSDVNMTLDKSQTDSHIAFFTKGKTVQDDLNGSFEVRLNLNKWEKIDWNHLQTHPESLLDSKTTENSDLSIHVSNFPTEVIDRLIALKSSKLKGSITALLGDRLSIFLEKLPNPNYLEFKLTAETPALTGSVKGKIDGEILKILEPANFNLNLNSEEINPYLKDYDFELLNSSNMHFILKSFSLPFMGTNNQIRSCDFGFELQMEILKGMTIRHKALGDVVITDLKLGSLGLLCEPKIHTLFKISGIKDGQTFDISAESAVEKPQFFNRFLEEIKNNPQLTLSVHHLPLSLIRGFNKHSVYANSIGSSVDFHAMIKKDTSDSQQWLINFSLDSGNLIAKDVLLKISEQISLDRPLKLQWRYAPTQDDSELDNIKHITIELNQLHLLWNDEKGIEKLQLESKISEAQFSLEKIPENLKIENLEIKIDGKKDFYVTTILGTLSLINREGHFSPLLEHSVELNSSATFRIESNQTISIIESKTELTNSAMSAEFEASYIDQKLTLNKPLLISYPLTPISQRVIEEYTGQQLPRIEQTTHVGLRIEPIVLDLAVPSPITKLQAKGLLSFDHIKLEDPTDKLPVLEEIELPWMINGLNNEFSINLEGLAYAKTGSKPGYLTASLQVSNWIKDSVYDISSMKIEVNADLTGLPTAVASTLLVNEDWTSVFGPVLDIDFSTLIDREQQTSGYVDLKLDSANFHIKGRFKLDDSFELFSPHKPAEVRFKVTPEAFLLLKSKFDLFDDLILSDSVTISGNVSQLNLPLDPKLFKRGTIEAKLTTSFIQWHDRNSIPFTLRGVIRSENINNQVYFSFSAKSQKEAPLKIKGTIGNFFDNDGHMNAWDRMYLDSEIKGEKITSQFLKSLLFLKQETESNLEVLLGRKFNINATCQLQNLSGPIKAVLSSEQTNAQFIGKLEHGNLFLTSPFEYKTRFNPSFNKAPFTKSIPFSKYILKSDEPVYFKIYPEKFSCQLFPFNLKSLSIDKGEINLGKVQFLNQGDVSKVLSIISPISSDQFEIWFTPLYFQIKNSIVNVNRTDFLVNSRYPLAIWGMWNFLNNHADLVLGIPEYTLKYAFGIKNLNSDYVLPMVLKSKQDKFTLDRKSLLANVSSLLAQMQLGKSGQLIGQFIDPKQTQIPQPTTSPFPWGEIIQTSQPQQETVTRESEEKEDLHKKSKLKKKNKFLKNLDSNKVVEEMKNQALQAFEGWLNH